MAIRETVARNIRALRKRAGLSQQKVADRTGLSLRYVSGLENEALNITLETLEKVAAGLGCLVENLVVESPPSTEAVKDRARQTEIQVQERARKAAAKAEKTLNQATKQAMRAFLRDIER